jgi:hypothetical protein
MKTILAALALIALGSAPSLAFDADTTSLIARYKSHKPVAAKDLQTLMRASERWCYDQEAQSCSWSDIYLSIDSKTARFEIGSPWSEDIDLSYIERANFDDDGRLCENDTGWIETLFATNHADGVAIHGRALQAIKDELNSQTENGVTDCFAYLYLSADENAQTVQLLQRQYADGAYQADKDVAVTLHFDATSASTLTLRY